LERSGVFFVSGRGSAMKYALAVLRNIIVLVIAIAVFGKAESGFEKIVFSLLVMIYLSIEPETCVNKYSLRHFGQLYMRKQLFYGTVLNVSKR
jgi:hypothetical protein